MRYAIWGAGKTGEWLRVTVERMNLDNEIELVCFGDNNKDIIGKNRGGGGGLPVLSWEEIQKLYDSKKIDAVVIATCNQFVAEIAEQLMTGGISELYMVPYYIPGNRIIHELDRNSLFVKIDGKKPRLGYFEYHICDHCNLNCKGCGHFCPLVKEPVFGDLEAYERDLKRLKELVWGVTRIRLMGGEPLLNSQLKEFVEISRNAFKDSMLKVVTNGLLIDKVDESLFEIMRENDCEFDISLYPPTNKIKHRIQGICDLYGVRYHFSPLITEFGKRKDILGEQNIDRSFSSCTSKTCTFLRNGKISACILPQNTDVFNQYFGTEMKGSEKDIIDLYDKTLDGTKLIERLNTPLDTCRYCRENIQMFQWSVATDKPKAQDWIADN